MPPRLLILAGPNGAGKSTFHASHLAGKWLPFVNADLLAKELGVGAYEAAEVADEIRARLVVEGRGFITETVFSDPAGSKLAFLRDAAARGYAVTLFYIGLESVALSEARVRARVARGGHDVPTSKLEARYRRSLENLARAIAEVAQVVLFDNSDPNCPHRFIAEFRSGKLHARGGRRIPRWARKFALGKR
jgi:predicted ABC-type ATPase